MRQTLIQTAETPVEEIRKLVEIIEPILLEAGREKAITACLATAITLQNPFLTFEDMLDGIKGASDWIVLFLEQRETEKEIAEGNEALILN